MSDKPGDKWIELPACPTCYAEMGSFDQGLGRIGFDCGSKWEENTDENGDVTEMWHEIKPCRTPFIPHEPETGGAA